MIDQSALAKLKILKMIGRIERANRKKWMFALFILIVILCAGCSYYRIVKIQEDRHISNTLESQKLENKFIVHRFDEIYLLDSVYIEDFVLYGYLTEPLDYMLENKEKIYKSQGSTRLKNRREAKRETHIFLANVHASLSPLLRSNIAIPLEKIFEVRLYEKDRGQSAFHTVLTVLGTSALMFGGALAIVASTKSSCPFVYSVDGSDLHLEGELYGGAFFKSLERRDILKLRYLRPSGDKYQIRLANELKETQHINTVDLLIAKSKNNLEVHVDQTGRLITIESNHDPQSATDKYGKDILRLVSNRDGVNYSFNDHRTNQNEMLLTFNRPDASQKMKLVLKAKSSYWSDFIWGEFAFYHGYEYADFVAKQNDANKAYLEYWKKEAGIPLVILLMTNNGWTEIHRWEHTGPLAYRDLVTTIDLSNLDSDQIQIKLLSGFQMWDVDDATADFSDNEELELEILKPVKATDQDGVDWTEDLLIDDDKYFHQFNIGDQVVLDFMGAGVEQNIHYSYFLQSKGYYNHIRDFSNLPNYFEINKFHNPAYYMEFSRKRYKEFIEREMMPTPLQ